MDLSAPWSVACPPAVFFTGLEGERSSDMIVPGLKALAVM
jgi:hypothetical protein